MENSWSSLDVAKASIARAANASGTLSTTCSSPCMVAQPKGSPGARPSTPGQERGGRQGLFVHGVAIGAAERGAQGPGQAVRGQGQDELLDRRAVHLRPGQHELLAPPPFHAEPS